MNGDDESKTVNMQWVVNAVFSARTTGLTRKELIKQIKKEWRKQRKEAKEKAAA